jgi:phage terminase large subunit
VTAAASVVVQYEPRGAARDLMSCKAPEVCISGPAGSGKSLAMLFKLHLACLMVPRLRALLVRQTHASLTGTTLVTFERDVAGPMLASGAVRWFGGSSREPAAYRYSNGSTILVGGLDRPEKFLSSEFDRITVDEATQISERAWETLITRLRGTAVRKVGGQKIRVYKQIVGGCNPDHPFHWIKLRSERGSLVMLNSLHRDNPAYFNLDGTATVAGRDYMSKLNALTGVRRRRLLGGLWVAAEGVIYELDGATHFMEPGFVPPAEWPRFLSVDFGFTNPLCAQWWASDPDGRLYMFREHYKTQTLVEDHAADILAACTRPDPDYVHPARKPRYAYHGRVWTEPRPRAVVCDHDAEDRATLERHLGMSTEGARKSVKNGIEAVQSRLKVAGDGRPRLFLVRGALVERDPRLADAKKPTCTEEEVGGYVWAPGSDGKPAKEEPLKLDDHGCDCLRYACAHVDLGVQPRMRWMGG